MAHKRLSHCFHLAVKGATAIGYLRIGKMAGYRPTQIRKPADETDFEKNCCRPLQGGSGRPQRQARWDAGSEAKGCRRNR